MKLDRRQEMIKARVIQRKAREKKRRSMGIRLQ
jgi:hypothetical protein